MLIPLNLERDRPLQLQLYQQLHGLIASARLRPGSRMPSTRMLAEQFAISRITVLLTYERLIAEGYLETRPAKGTFVAQVPDRPVSSVERPASFENAIRLRAAADARFGRPDPSLFPVGRWRGLMRSALDALGAHVGTVHAAGNPALRNAIAGWLSSSRGLAVAPEQVLLLNGRQQAMHLIAHLQLRQGARVVVEDPCDPDVAAMLSDEHATLIRVPVDADGLRTECLPEGEVALIHVTPEHQRPLGVSLSRARRTALLDWAAQSGALVLEEDCEGELRYNNMHAPSLMSLDSTERVILLGGFCTSLGPWVDLAYLVLPRRLIAPALAARRLIDDSHGRLEEAALAEFLASGAYARHLHRLGKAYASRRDALLAALRLQFGPAVTTWGAHAGLHLAWFPRPGIGASAYLAAMARRCGLEAAALPASSLGSSTAPDPILLGFGSLPERQIEMRIAQFAGHVQADSPVAALSAD